MKKHKIIKLIAISGICILCNSLCFAQQQTYKYPFQDKEKSFEIRTEDLLKRLTVEEKVQLMMDFSKPIERLGIKPYNWWSEALHGVARSGLATVFPQPIGMAASFDEKAVYNVFSAVSDEARAKYNSYASKNSFDRYQGLTVWTPTINIFRDPRWGRGMETYGEDPYLMSILGVAVVKGLQGPKEGKYDKLYACAKHFAVHSGPEGSRHSFNANNIKKRDLYETYLPAFEALVKDGNVQQVMCAYNRFEGDPCCGSDQLLTQILRNKWGFKGIVVSDCGAINDFYASHGHKTHADVTSASSSAVRAGTDLECGDSYVSLIEGVKKGLITEKEIDVSVRRLLLSRFRLGEMDKPEDVSWNKIPYQLVGSKKHDALALDMARKSMTLLLNKNQTLPLKRGKLKIAVMGPNAKDSVMQWGNYNGFPPHTVTLLEGIRKAMGKNDQLIYVQGTDLVEGNTFESAYNLCETENGKGFKARYWNNKEQSGAPVTEETITTPLSFSTTGATVFAPRVALTDFSASYTSTLKPIQSGEVVFNLNFNGHVKLLINKKQVIDMWTEHGNQKTNYNMQLEKGKAYSIQIDFAQHKGDALLNFDLEYKKTANTKSSIDKVMDADIVLFAGGISPALEGEEQPVSLPGFSGGDRTDIELPAVQRQFISELKKAGKKVVLINYSGSAIGLVPETENCDAILQAWYPGQTGGTAVAEVLFGDYNPSGRLPVTFYRDVNQLPDFQDYNMKGRTYRYFEKDPLFHFGYGLSYSTFRYGKPRLSNKTVSLGKKVQLVVPITNTSARNGDEIVQVYLKKMDDKEGPQKDLRAMQRVNIPAGKTKEISITLSGKQLSWWDKNSSSVRTVAGEFELMVGTSSRDTDLQKIRLSIKK